MEYFGRVIDGVLKITKRGDFDNEVKQFEGHQVIIKVERYKATRSAQQNRYYFGVVCGLIRERLKELGHDLTIQETHEFLRGRFNSKELIDLNGGEIIQVGNSTSKLNKSEFMEYLEKIKQFSATTLELYIPDPNEQLEIKT